MPSRHPAERDPWPLDILQHQALCSQYGHTNSNEVDTEVSESGGITCLCQGLLRACLPEPGTAERCRQQRLHQGRTGTDPPLQGLDQHKCELKTCTACKRNLDSTGTCIATKGTRLASWQQRSHLSGMLSDPIIIDLNAHAWCCAAFCFLPGFLGR